MICAFNVLVEENTHLVTSSNSDSVKEERGRTWKNLDDYLKALVDPIMDGGVAVLH
ncbi:hypothetical protein CY34DRAFT_19638 [Suillus luteus UH-Slu-Lm8-n1]|uniref:Uncharacterized protein n=1 Tax=Suillus luteus UH-Slu-Lm8-n1 TaxID=930992 RepID=A0A0D0AI58_9AGAM|nr:hypothetical protein CY34DRAFT_19638 [Suillus luteus UH-Slu-Lm8-n1]